MTDTHRDSSTSPSDHRSRFASREYPARPEPVGARARRAAATIGAVIFLPIWTYRQVTRGWLSGDAVAASVITVASVLFGVVVLGPVVMLAGMVAPLAMSARLIVEDPPVGPVELALAWLLTAFTLGPTAAWYSPVGARASVRTRFSARRPAVDRSLIGLADVTPTPESVVVGLGSDSGDVCSISASALRRNALVVGEPREQRADLALRLAGWYARTHRWATHSVLVIDLEGSDELIAGLERIAVQSGRPYRLWVPGAPLPEWTRAETGEHLVESIVPTMDGVVVVDASSDRGTPVDADAAVERAAEFLRMLRVRRGRDTPTDELLVVVHGFGRHHNVAADAAAMLQSAADTRLLVVLTSESHALIDDLDDPVVRSVRDHVAVTVALRDREGAESLATRLAGSGSASHLTHPNVLRHLHDGSAVIANAADPVGTDSLAPTVCRLATHDPCALIERRDAERAECRVQRVLSPGLRVRALAAAAGVGVLSVLAFVVVSVRPGVADDGPRTSAERWVSTFGDLWISDDPIRSAGLVALAGHDVPPPPGPSPEVVFVSEVRDHGDDRWTATLTTIDETGSQSGWAVSMLEHGGRWSLASDPVPTEPPTRMPTGTGVAETFDVDDASTTALGPFVVDVLAAWGRGLDRDRVFVERMSTPASGLGTIGGLDLDLDTTTVEVSADRTIARVDVTWRGLGSFRYRVDLDGADDAPRVAAIVPWPDRG